MPVIVAGPIANTGGAAHAVVGLFMNAPDLANVSTYRIVECPCPFSNTIANVVPFVPQEQTLLFNIGGPYHTGWVATLEYKTALVPKTLNPEIGGSPAFDIGPPINDVPANGIQVQFHAYTNSIAEFYPIPPPTITP